MSATGWNAAIKGVSFERERGVYDVRVATGLAHAEVQVGGDAERVKNIGILFRALADEGIPIFLIHLHARSVTFAVEANMLPQAEACLSRLHFEASIRHNLARVDVVASSMRDLTGVMVQIAEALQKAGARLYGVGDSHNSVQCLIDGAYVETAVAQLKRTFGLEGERV
jgi:aspartokinase